MFPIGLFEIILTLSLALVILGPDKLFIVARYFGLMLRKLRALYSQLTDEFDKQLRLDEMLKSGTLKPIKNSTKVSKQNKTPKPAKSKYNDKSKNKSKNKSNDKSPTKSNKTTGARELNND